MLAYANGNRPPTSRHLWEQIVAKAAVKILQKGFIQWAGGKARFLNVQLDLQRAFRQQRSELLKRQDAPRRL
jgi:hypothetical protein